MAEKRKDWRKRTCAHGNQVEFRWRLDIAFCGHGECLTASMAKLGWQRITEKRIAEEETKRP